MLIDIKISVPHLIYMFIPILLQSRQLGKRVRQDVSSFKRFEPLHIRSNPYRTSFLKVDHQPGRSGRCYGTIINMNQGKITQGK